MIQVIALEEEMSELDAGLYKDLLTCQTPNEAIDVLLVHSAIAHFNHDNKSLELEVIGRGGGDLPAPILIRFPAGELVVKGVVEVVYFYVGCKVNSSQAKYAMEAISKLNNEEISFPVKDILTIYFEGVPHYIDIVSRLNNLFVMYRVKDYVITFKEV